MTSLNPEHPVALTGFDLELECGRCGTVQQIHDPVDPGYVGLLSHDEFVELTAQRGSYRLCYRLRCYACNRWLTGSLIIRSRKVSAYQRGPAGYGPG